jgi:hypothetical protein
MLNERQKQRLGVGFLKINEIKLRSEATSLFDVQRWTFDVYPPLAAPEATRVGSSSFKQSVGFQEKHAVAKLHRNQMRLLCDNLWYILTNYR